MPGLRCSCLLPVSQDKVVQYWTATLVGDSDREVVGRYTVHVLSWVEQTVGGYTGWCDGIVWYTDI